MKTKTFWRCLAFAVTALFLAAACEDSDNVSPVIDLEEPADGDTLRIGAGVHFEMDLSDNEALKSYRVAFHDNFDGHGHDSRADEETISFTYDRSWDVSGKKSTHVHHHDIIIAANATPGPYHMEVYCTDASGNEAYLVRDVVLSHEGGEDDDED
ncbi:MAG: DUF4625 domain-containing protein [Odoribacteraceae bacterium]|jgi:hypothetical protein|nr:DUF4625 domain-containing protein [Odoribacteraceae bacterium]